MGVDINKMRAQAAKIKARREQNGPDISVRKGSGKRKKINIECQYEGDDVMYVSFLRIEHSHKKAVLIKFSDDQKEWVPFSHIRDVDVDDRILVCSEWIANEKGLDPIDA